MKNLHKTILAVALLILAIGVNAQNRCVLNSSKKDMSVITYSENMMVVNQKEDHISLIGNFKESFNNFRGLNATHHLIVNLPDNFGMMKIGNESGTFSDMFFSGQGSYEANLEEGLYYLIVNGYLVNGTEYYSCVWTHDFEINGDMELSVNFADCNYTVNINAVNEFGIPMEECEINSVDYTLELNYHDLMVTMDAFHSDNFTSEIPHARYNGFNENCAMKIYAVLNTFGETKNYFLFWSVNGMDDNLFLNCEQDELASHSEAFHVSSPEGFDATYNLDYKIVTGNSWGGIEGRSNNIYKNGDLFTVVSNAKVTDPNNPDFVLLMPNVYEWFDEENQNWPIYNDKFRSAFYFDANGNAIKEPKPMFFFGNEAGNNFRPNSPLKLICTPDKVCYNGLRTPLAYYVPQSLTAEQYYGEALLTGALYFSGETGCERNSDTDGLIRICSTDGTELYNDSIFKYNEEGYFMFEEPEEINIHVENNHLVYDGVAKSNIMDIVIDYSKDDVMPPTTTFLRINDNYGQESIELPQIESSSLVFGCADYKWHLNQTLGYYDYIVYDSKPMVELSYSIGERSETFPLAFTEDESLFNNNYGNVFVVDLSQLNSIANDNWVNLIFTLTDDAGNVQKQELKNVFYVGEMTSVNEQASTLTHTAYPNPFTNEVRINAAETVNGNASISVFNVLGEQVISKAMNCNETTEFVIDGSSLNAGIYFYSIATENGTLQGRIVKE